MTVSYSFSSHPRRSVTLTASDGSRQLSVTEPIDGVAAGAWRAFESSGYAEPEQFLSAMPQLLEKLRRTESVIETTLATIRRDANAMDSGRGFVEYAREIIERDKAAGRTAARPSKYADVIGVFSKFLAARGMTDVRLVDFNSALVDDFCAQSRRRGIKESSLAFYCRILGAIYHSAVRAGLINDVRPFVNAPNNMRPARGAAAAVAPTAGLDALFAARLDADPVLGQARDIIRFIYLTGLNLVQVLTLRPADVADGYITVRGRRIALTDELRALTARHAGSDYCFYPAGTRPRNIVNVRNRFNRHLRALATALSLPEPPAVNDIRRQAL